MVKTSISNPTLDAANRYLQKAQSVLHTLETHQELFSQDYLINFELENKSLANRIRVASDKCRKLSIGIIGTVKAGKSSFLNALLFGGEPFLPKASTPMTATLTKISYSKTPSAVVHFYSHDDYAIIESKAQQYNALLDSSYNSYVSQLQAMFHDLSPREKIATPQPPLPTKDEFERLNFSSNDVARELQAYKEIVTATERNPDILNLLGTDVPLTGDIRTQLQAYVSGSGKYTPIVSFVEYQVDNPELEGLEVVDTPGMNDPIVSRGKKTREFLSQCDATILLSPCGQFMDAGVIENISRALPSAGVEKILVVGSKLDSGIRNDKGGSFLAKLKKSATSYLKQYNNALAVPIAGDAAKRIIEQLRSTQPIFISSMCYGIRLKQKNRTPLDAEESKCLSDLRASFDDFSRNEDTNLAYLSGIEALREQLKIIRDNKIHIIEQRDGSLLDSSRHNHLSILDDILADIHSRSSRLKDADLAELRSSIRETRTAIDRSRKQLSAVFKITSIGAEKKITDICANIRTHIKNYRDIDITKKTRENHYTVKTGIFGWGRKHVTEIVTTYEASVSNAYDNILGFHGKCVQLINQDFDYLLNSDELSRKVKEIVLSAMGDADLDFNKDDILIPLGVVLAKIKLPKLTLSCDKYLDELNARFPTGMAQNEDTHKLNATQSELLAAICNDFTKELQSCGVNIKNMMNEQAESFADEISKKFEDMLNALTQQIEDKEHYLALYEALPDQIHEIRRQLSQMR